MKHISEVLAECFEDHARNCTAKAQDATGFEDKVQLLLSAKKFLRLAEFCTEANRQRQKIADERLACAADLQRHAKHLAGELRAESDQRRRDSLLRDIQLLNETRANLLTREHTRWGTYLERTSHD